MNIKTERKTFEQIKQEMIEYQKEVRKTLNKVQPKLYPPKNPNF